MYAQCTFGGDKSCFTHSKSSTSTFVFQLVRYYELMKIFSFKLIYDHRAAAFTQIFDQIPRACIFFEFIVIYFLLIIFNLYCPISLSPQVYVTDLHHQLSIFVQYPNSRFIMLKLSKLNTIASSILSSCLPLPIQTIMCHLALLCIDIESRNAEIPLPFIFRLRFSID